MGPASRDEGSIHVLEAMVVATIMLSAIVFVVTYDQPVTAEANARDGLARAADDALAILYETPVDSRFGQDALSAYIAECLNDMCDNLERKLDALTPEGGAYALYVSNGYDTYPVLVQGEPAGEAVAASQAFEPMWSSTFVSTATDLVGVGDALLAYELPIFNSNVVSPGGSHLLLKMEGSRRDGSDFVMIGSYSTVARPDSDDSALAASLYFVDADGAPMAVHAPADAVSGEIEVLLRLEETQQGTIPAGVQVDVDLPRGWTGYAAPTAGWTIVSAATDMSGAYVGSTISATIDADLSDDHLDLPLRLTYHGDELDYYPVHARLTRGALATATLLLRGEEHGGAPAYATPMIGMSAPSPMGNSEGDPTTWTIFAYAPVETSGFGTQGTMSAEIDVRRIEVRELDGNEIFDSVIPLEMPDGGEWISTGDTIAWYPDDATPFSLRYDQPLNLTFQVVSSGVAGPSEARSAFVPPLSFNDYTGKLVERSGWGFHRQAFLPATSEYDGFDPDATSGEDGWKTEHAIEADATYRSTPLPGTSTYSSSLVGSIEDALYGAYVAAQDRTVPVGGEVVVEANVQSLLFKLAEVNQRAGVTMRFYPPWSGDERVPIFEQQNLDQGVLSGEVTEIILIDLNGDTIPDPVIGTTNGRVMAYSGLTGQRLQGNTFTAPVTALAAQANTLPRINALAPIVIGGEPYVVVGTDKNSDGLFVLDSALEPAWYWTFTGADVLAIDTQTSFDADGTPEIVATRSFEVGAAENALTYVFRANARTAEQIEEGTSVMLEPIPAAEPVPEDHDAFHYSLGTPSMVTTQERAGPYGNGPGVLVPVQTLLDPGITLNQNTLPPTMERGALSTPRAGLLSVDSDGVARSTLFGAPASVVRSYDHGPQNANDVDGVDDVVMGGSSGYVIMANGTVLTQPMYSYILSAPAIIDADSRSSAESYALTDDGIVLMTDDAWLTSWGPDTTAPGGNAIAANDHNSYWVVGEANQMWTSVASLEPPLPSRAHMPPYMELVQHVPLVDDDPLFFFGKVYSLNDVWFRGDDGWVVGSTCTLDIIEVTCPSYPIVITTSDGGATWTSMQEDDFTEAPEADLTRVKFFDGNGWILGEAGTVLRKLESETVWTAFDLGEGADGRDLLDIDCQPNDLDKCIIVGTLGTVYRVADARGTPTFDDVSGEEGIAEDKTLFSVGYQTSERVYIGSENAIYASFLGADWTELPMNYLRNDVRAINALGDGSGFVYGGDQTARIWLLHDHHTQSQAQTIDLANAIGLPADALITSVTTTETDVSLGGQEVILSVATLNDNWHTMGTLAVSTDDPTADPRDALPLSTTISGASGRELRFRVAMNTTGDKTIVTPHVRLLAFEVAYTSGGVPATADVTLDFADDAWKDDDATTADWNTTHEVLRQRIVGELWTRDVNGEVLDLQTGYDAGGLDTRDDIWVATGDVLAENSPDHAIYAVDPEDPSEVVEPDDRVYLLDGANGDIIRRSDALAGEVRAIRLSDDDGQPGKLYAIAWDGVEGWVYAMDPWTLAVETSWPIELGAEAPTDMELGYLDADRALAFVGTQRTAEADSTGHLWAFDTQTQRHLWRAIPDDLGKYEVAAYVEPGWLFGPYVVEVEVEWEESQVGSELPSEVVRSARFYDHFMVTPPDVLSPPTPVYTARLLMWMRDWG